MIESYAPPLHDVSFVVPALDEEDYLGELFDSIARFTPDSVSHEVILVDNGSSDGTVALAKSRGAKVLELPGASLGTLRNEGAHAATGRVLVFLDADVRLREGWRERFPHTLSQLMAHPSIVTGSACLPPSNGGWVARAWADHSARSVERNHLGTGHLVVDRTQFLRVGGFNPFLATGEDFEFCRRVQQEGLLLAPDMGLEVEHVRYPNSILDFIRRERWHGEGDGQGPRTIVTSSVVRAAAAFVLLHLAIVITLLADPAPRGLIVALILSGGIALLCGVGAFRRGGIGHPLRFVARTWLVYWYLWSRFIAAFVPSQRTVRRTEAGSPDRGARTPGS